MEDSGKALLAFGAGAAASLGLWWLLRGRVDTRGSPDPAEFKTSVATVAKVYVYPVKSCHRVEVESTECLVRGLKYDRCWVITDEDGGFVHQRKYPTLAQIQPRLEFGEEGRVTLYLTAPNMPELMIREPPASAATTTVRVWNMSGECVDVGDEAGEWVSRFLQKEGCRISYMAPQHRPRVLQEDKRWTSFTKPGDETGFADFSPVLLASEASLDMLNSKLQSPLPIERFRPNIILTGCQPHAEDNWEEIKVGESLLLRGLKPCGRCVMTTVDQELGHFTGQEPLQTLRSYRLHENVYESAVDSRYGNSPLFGFNYSVLQPGPVRVGDTVYCK